MQCVITSAVTMVKSHEKKKNSKLFSYDGVVKCCRNLNFEKMDTASYTGKNDGVWWGIFKEYLKQNIIMKVLRITNAHSVVICRSIKKINNVHKNRSKRKNWFKVLCIWVLVWRDLT